MIQDLILLSAAPVDKYFVWQYEIFITNARKYDLSKNIVITVWYPEARKSELGLWDNLKTKYPEVNIHYYLDEGVDLGLYIPQLRPHSLKKYFKEYETSLKGKRFFYHDSDIIFTKKIDFEELMKGDICWQSDTSSYLDYTYLRKKEIQGNIPENEAISILANIGGISIDTIKSYTGNTGGAQYILKNIDYTFWEDVERMCIHIRGEFSHHIKGSVNDKYFKTESEGFQSWCADMWAVNFSLWKRGLKTSITPLLDFSWATDSMETFNTKPVFHNAGVVNSKQGLFHKGSYINDSPLTKENLRKIKKTLNTGTASYGYFKAMEEVK